MGRRRIPKTPKASRRAVAPGLSRNQSSMEKFIICSPRASRGSMVTGKASDDGKKISTPILETPSRLRSSLGAPKTPRVPKTTVKWLF